MPDFFAPQDFRITELAAAEGRAVVVVINKWDLVRMRCLAHATHAEGHRIINMVFCIAMFTASGAAFAGG